MSLKSKYLYLLVTKDKYELPIMVEDSPTELARKCGVTTSAIISNAAKAERGGVIQSRWRRVLIEDDTEEV